MAHSVDFNGIKYVPSTIAGSSIGYSSDYVARLAREKKIEAKRVGRQWFVNPISLENFYANANREKKNRQKKLREVRVAERKNSELVKSKVYELVDTPLVVEAMKNASAAGALFKSTGIVFAGVLLGMVLYSGSGELQHPGVLVASMHFELVSVMADINSEISYVSNTFAGITSTLSDKSSRASISTQSGGQVEDSEEMTPQVATENRDGLVVIPDSPTAKSDLESIRGSFSDEVIITEDPDGDRTGVITPVFRNKNADESNERYRFLMVPVAEGREP